ncbi:restriction endonuclease subunit S [Streptococcus suis]
MVYRSNITSSSKVLPRLEFEDINSGLGTLNKDIFQKVNDDRKGLEFNEGDVLFGKLRPYLKNWWYAEFNGIALGDFWNLKSDVWHSCFLYTYIQSNAFQLVANDTSGTKMPRSDWNLVAESIAKFPTLPEQKAIGTFFSTLDQQITLHQRKLDKLKNVKQAYLSEMFPAEGERVPKRRFPCFTDAWELRKLKLLFIFKYGDGNNNPSNGGPYPVFGAGGVQGGYTEYNSENSIIIGHMGDAGCVSWGEGKHFVTYNGTITRPKEEVFTAKFGYYLLSKMNLRQYRGGSGLPFLTYDMLNDMDTIVPTNKSECDKISEFFSTLDQQITLHQRKLEKLKNLKKALLNELFV